MNRMLKKLKDKLAGRSAFARKEAYFVSLLRRNLSDTLLFEDAELSKVRELIKKEFSLEDYPLEIHKNDIMFHYHLLQVGGDMVPALYSHFAVGARFLTNLAKYVDERGPEVNSILDFGSGYARVSRFIPVVWPHAELAVSEVKAEAMDFQKDLLGVTAIKHTQDATSFKATQFDMIIALSVFSHLPENSFRAWVSTLLRHLTNSGVLIFSFNNLDHNTGPRFKFVANSEDIHFPHIDSANLNTNEYGHAYMNRQLIEDAIGEGFTLEVVENELTLSQLSAIVRRR